MPGGFEANKHVLFDVMKLVQWLLRSLPPSSSDASLHIDDGDHHGNNDDPVTDLLRAYYFQQGRTAVAVAATMNPTDISKLDDDAASPSPELHSLPQKTLLPYSSYIARITFEEFNYSTRKPSPWKQTA